MIYLCRFHQRNRLIEVPFTSEQQGISHDNLKHLISMKRISLAIHLFVFSSRISVESNTKNEINRSNME